MSGGGSFDPSRLPDPEVQDPDVSRDVELGTASREDFTAPDTDPVANANREELLAMVESQNAAERRRGILALAERGRDDTAAGVLETVSREDPDADARQFAIEALARVGADPETIAVGLDDADPWVRAETVVSLKKTAAAESVDRFEAALDDPHPAVRRNALISLHHVRGEDALATLSAGLDDESERVREWAVRLLGAIDTEEAARTIVEAMQDEQTEIVREAGARALDGSSDVDMSAGGSTVRADDHVLNRMPDR